MAAVAGFPSLSQLLAWPTEHLTEAAEHWEAIGARSYAVANQVWRDALSVDWQGEAADALHTETHADMTTTSAVADTSCTRRPQMPAAGPQTSLPPVHGWASR